MRSAADLEEKTENIRSRPGPVLPARELAGRVVHGV